MNDGLRITQYSSTNTQDPTVFDPEWLEETNEGPLSPEWRMQLTETDIRDADGDGHLEYRRSALENIINYSSNRTLLPLAAYFADEAKNPSTRTNESSLPKALKGDRNFSTAANYFKNLVVKTDNPLKKIADPLANYLAHTAMHSGVDLASDTPLENGSGFSVHRSGRLRFDCEAYVKLAHFLLKNIKGLDFQLVQIGEGLPSSTGPQMNNSARFTFDREIRPSAHEYDTPNGLEDSAAAHVVLLISDSKSRHLIVDNHAAYYLPKTTNPERFIQGKYPVQVINLKPYPPHSN